LLFDRGANVNAPENDLWAPLHLATDKGKISVSQLLVERSAEVDSRDKMDWTALHFASQQGRLELVRLLLEHGADALARNQEGYTFLDVAWANGHREIVEVNARYEDGLTTIHIIALKGRRECEYDKERQSRVCRIGSFAMCDV
jgi:ankyrin repeat protein